VEWKAWVREEDKDVTGETDVFKLDVTEFTKFGDGIVSNLSWNEELDEAHRLRA
jgi:hypothetical protein